MHPRTAIVAAIVLALDGNTDASDRVYPSRIIDYIPGDTTPVMAIYVTSETSKLGNNAPREYDRTAELHIECMVKAVTGVALELAMNNLSEQIENIMDIDYTFGLEVYESELMSTDMDIQDEGGDDAGVLEMTYMLKYRTDAWVAVVGDAATTDYERTQSTINLAGAQAAADTTDNEFDQEP